MERAIKTSTLLLVWLCIYSCNESPHIDFHSYQELSEYSFISNNWIPALVGKDAYTIQETYDTNNKHVFGKFDFKFRTDYDSIMKSYPATENDSLFARIAEILKPGYPEWFIPKEDLKKGNYVLAKYENFYLIMEKKVNRIYYLR
jgi:hypothetical protein